MQNSRDFHRHRSVAIIVTTPQGQDPKRDEHDRSQDEVRRAERFLEILEAITAANRELLPTMTEKYFRRMVIRMAEHQLLYEEYERDNPGAS
jgi:hypothetical protein